MSCLEFQHSCDEEKDVVSQFLIFQSPIYLEPRVESSYLIYSLATAWVPKVPNIFWELEDQGVIIWWDAETVVHVVHNGEAITYVLL